MATNLKGKGKAVSILLLHGEKIAIGLFAVVALWFIYKSVKVPRLDDNFQADKLNSEITQTKTEVSSFTWDTAVKDHPDKVKKSQPIADQAEMSVNPEVYVPRDAKGSPNLSLGNSIVAPLILRTDPLILNVVDVRATGGSGLFAFVDEEIRKSQAIKAAAEAQEAQRKADAKAKKDAQNNAAGAAPGGRRRGAEGPGEGANEPIDPNHPKRRMVGGSVRPTGNMTQGGERIERAYWACVVAKVPIREQFKLYQDAFEKARGANPTTDFPSYVGFYVERSEVELGKELAWTPVPLYDGQRQSIVDNKPLTTAPSKHVVAKPAYEKLITASQQFWAGGMSMDVIDPRFAEFPLTLPLPPLIGREWGSEATHPDIPLAINTPPLENEMGPQEVPATQQDAGAAGGGFGSAAPATPGGPGAGPGGMPFGPGGPGGGFSRRFGGPEGGPGMGPGGRMPMGPGGAGPEGGGPGGFRGGGGGGQAAGQHTTLTKGVDYYLLRFFDFSVEPGKKYKYRVKLVLQDPNYNLGQGVLSAAVLDRQDKELQALRAKNPKAEKPFYRIVDKWSDPSPPVGIPMAGNVRLADTKIPAAEKVGDEPTVKMLVEAFDVNEAGTPIQAAMEKDFRRGYVANFVSDAEYLVDPTMIDTQPSFKFFTGMTLLDVDGGAKIPGAKDLTYPARILVMGPAGELYIRSDTDDKPYVESHKMIFEKTNSRGPEGPGGPGGPGAGGRRPRR